MSNPVDEYLEKYAARGGRGFPAYADIARAVAEGIQRAGGRPKPKGPMELGKAVGLRAGALAGAFGLYAAAQKTYSAITKQRDFNAMLEGNPDLAAEHKRDPKTFNRLYGALRSMNPQFAAEPVVAGTYMRRMMQSPESAGGTIVESLQAARGTRPQVRLTMGEEPSIYAQS